MTSIRETTLIMADDMIPVGNINKLKRVAQFRLLAHCSRTSGAYTYNEKTIEFTQINTQL